MAAAFPPLGALARSHELSAVARAARGLDGRTMRKLVAAACTRAKEVALDPGRLTTELLLETARSVVASRDTATGRVR
jgi:hypothetical protein